MNYRVDVKYNGSTEWEEGRTIYSGDYGVDGGDMQAALADYYYELYNLVSAGMHATVRIMHQCIYEWETLIEKDI